MKPRHAEGGAYVSRGTWYARVTMAQGKRVGVLLPWARPEDEAPAQDRARALQGMVSRLRERPGPWRAGGTGRGPTAVECSDGAKKHRRRDLWRQHGKPVTPKARGRAA
jgi:hypothetical protein